VCQMKMTVFIIIHVPGCVCVGSEEADETYPCPKRFGAEGQDHIAGRAGAVETL